MKSTATLLCWVFVLPRLSALVLALTLVLLAFAACDTLLADEDKAALGTLAPRGARRVIYNSDLSNTTLHMSEPAKPEELREVVRNYRREGAIDTLVQEVWHQGWSTFWRSDHCDYDPRPQHQRLVPMMDSGVVPLEVYIDECHRQKMEFLAGFRMNDRHGENPDLFERVGREHPEWVLGFKPTSRGADPRSRALGCSFDYAQPGVRDWLFSIMKEVVNRFDVDGLEFNFTRMPEVFRRETAAESHAVMTGFVRRVRAMLDEASARKGRKLLLGVRVLQSVAGCKKVGLDVPTWIRRGSIDYVAPADVGFTDFNARYEDFVKVARAYDCFVYPQIEARLSYPRRRETQTPAHSRAAAHNIYGAGADGFSTQNYQVRWGPSLENYPNALNLLKELRDPKLLGARDRHYVFDPSWGTGAGMFGFSETYQPESIELKRDNLGQRGEFRFRLCENLQSDSNTVTRAVLTFKPRIARGDEIAVDVNGTRILASDIRYEWPEEPNDAPVGRFALTSPPAVYGDNYLGLRLLRSAPGSEGDVTLYELEVSVVSKSDGAARE